MADGSIPLGVALRFIIRPQLVPILARNAVEVVHDFAVAHGELADQLLMAAKSRAFNVDEPEIAMFKAQHGNVCSRPYRKVAQLLVLNLAGGIPSGTSGNGTTAIDACLLTHGKSSTALGALYHMVPTHFQA